MSSRLNIAWATLCGGIFGLAISRSLFEYDPITFGLLRIAPGGILAAIFFSVVTVTTLKTFILNRPSLHAHRYSIFIPLLLPALIIFEPSTNLLRNGILIIGAIGGVAAIVLKTKHIPTLYPISLIIFIAFFYISTLAPAVGEADTFEMQVNAIRLGISHGSGYPLYLLLAKLFSLLPIGGTTALRINLSSATFGILAALALYHITQQLRTSRPASWIAAVSFAASIAFWSRAVEAEVYTLHIALIGLILLITLQISNNNHHPTSNLQFPTFKIYFLSLIFGLSLTNHLTTIILAPSLLISLFFLIPIQYNKLFTSLQELITKPNFLFVIRHLSFAILFFTLGLSVYLYLPIRWPAINNGELMTWDIFKHFITGQEAQGALRLNAWYNDLGRYEIVFRKVLDQFGWVGLITALIGLIALLRNNFRVALITLTAYVSFAFFAISFYVPDPDYSSFLLPNHFIQAVWIALGIQWIVQWITKQRPSTIQNLSIVIHNSAFIIFFLLPASLLWSNFSLIDKSNEWHFDKLGRYILSQPLKQKAAILADSELIAPLYYLQVAEGIRPDLDIVVLPNEEAYRAQLEERLDKGQTVYLGRYLPNLTDSYLLNSLTNLAEVSTTPRTESLNNIDQNFGGEIRLRGFKLEPTPESIRINLQWQASKPPTNNYRVALRLVDSKGVVRLINTPSIPVRKMFSTTAWQPNNIVNDFHQFDLDPSLESGTYNLQVGLFPPFSQKGLGDWFTLAPITVSPSTQTPTISYPLRARFSNNVWLMGYDIPSIATPNAPIPVKLFWALPQEITQPFNAEVCLESCETIQIDPTKHPKSTIIQTHTTLNAPALSNKYQVRVGVAASQAECGWFATQSSRCDLSVIAIEGKALNPSAINFKNQIVLESVKIETPTISPAQTVIVSTQWRGLKPMSDEYTVFVHLIGPDGLVHGQVDMFPVQGTLPTSQWNLNQIINDRFEVRVPDDAPKGEYRVEIGWYLLATLDRLSVMDVNGVEVDDKFVLTGLTVR